MDQFVDDGAQVGVGRIRQVLRQPVHSVCAFWMILWSQLARIVRPVGEINHENHSSIQQA